MNRIASFALLIGTLAIASCAKPLGTLTIINNSGTAYRGNIGETALNIAPTKEMSLELAQGKQTIALGSESIDVQITKERVTVLDPSGSGCYVVANFRPQYGDAPKPDVLIEEKFQQQKQFTLKEAVAANYGKKLPKKIADGSDARRLHKIDCASSDNNQQIADSVMRMP